MSYEEPSWSGGYDRRTNRRPQNDFYAILIQVLEKEKSCAVTAGETNAAAHADMLIQEIYTVLRFLRSGQNPLVHSELALNDPAHQLREISALGKQFPEAAKAAHAVLEAYTIRSEEVKNFDKVNAALGSAPRIGRLY